MSLNVVLHLFLADSPFEPRLGLFFTDGSRDLLPAVAILGWRRSSLKVGRMWVQDVFAGCALWHCEIKKGICGLGGRDD